MFFSPRLFFSKYSIILSFAILADKPERKPELITKSISSTLVGKIAFG